MYGFKNKLTPLWWGLEKKKTFSGFIRRGGGWSLCLSKFTYLQRTVGVDFSQIGLFHLFFVPFHTMILEALIVLVIQIIHVIHVVQVVQIIMVVWRHAIKVAEIQQFLIFTSLSGLETSYPSTPIIASDSVRWRCWGCAGIDHVGIPCCGAWQITNLAVRGEYRCHRHCSLWGQKSFPKKWAE